MPSESGHFDLLPWQTQLWRQVQAQRTQEKLPHALLLTGPEGIGKRAFAERLAAALACESDTLEAQPCGQCRSCRLTQSGTHPDIHWLEPEEGARQIKIDAVRDLIARTTLTTQAKGSRVFVISPAHAMNNASANALLKTLEEPSSSSTLLLLSSQPHLLPATIRSRCQVIAFRPVDAQHATQWLSEHMDANSAENALALVGGAPLAAMRAAEEGWLPRTQEMIQALTELKLRKINPMQVVAQWLEKSPETIFADLARICSDLMRLRGAETSSRLFLPNSREALTDLASGMELQRIFLFNDELNALRRQMSHNLNQQMVLEKIVTDWLAFTRPEAH